MNTTPISNKAIQAIIFSALAFNGVLWGDSSTITQEIVNKKQVTIEDIKTMNNAGITDDKIISLIKSTGSVYHLTSADVEDLKRAGVSKRVINFMLQTSYQ